MPYGSVKDAPKWVQDLGNERALKWVAIFNRVFAETHSEARAFAAAGAAVQKGGAAMKFERFVPIQKIDEDQRMVWGYASTTELDSQGDRITLDAMKGALPNYMRFGNVREMHQMSAVGKTLAASVDDKGLYIGAHVVDDPAWKKVKAGVYNGFSIGGTGTRSGEEIVGLNLVEISLVDRPANPSAVFDVWKAAGGDSDMDEKLLEALKGVSDGLAQIAKATAANTDAIAKLVKGRRDPDPPQDPPKDDPGSTARELELQTQLEALQKRMNDKEAREKADARKVVLDGACKAGKIRVADRGQWEKDYDANPSLVERLLKTMQPVVPIGERRGVGADGEDKGALQKRNELVREKMKELMEMDKVSKSIAMERAARIVSKENRELWSQANQESLTAGANAAKQAGFGFGVSSE